MELELTVDRLAVGGDGIAREPDGRIVFVRGALPGDTVLASITSQGRDFWRAEVSEVVVASVDRTAPTCPAVALGCGGCGWQHVSAPAQGRLKSAMVRDALVRQARLANPSVTVGPSVADLGYRTTVRFAVAQDGRLGLRRAASHEVVTLDSCPVAHPGMSAMLPALRARSADEVTIRVSEATGDATALLSAHGTGSARLEGAPATLRTGPDAYLVEQVAGRDLRVSAASFFQSSARSAALLVDAVSRAVGADAPTDHWADLYSGVGLFAATLFRDVRVTAVEREGSSTRDAAVNLAGRPATIVGSAVEDWAPEPCDVVVADPARSGLGKAGASTVVATGASMVVLVSCDAGSLGRDAGLLMAAGYEHRGSEVLDLFPQTPHVEVVSAFVRSGR